MAAAPLSCEAVESHSPLAAALAGAARPLVVTSYLGRNPAAVAGLLRLCRRLGIGVLESVPSAVNYPHDDPLSQRNHLSLMFPADDAPRQNAGNLFAHDGNPASLNRERVLFVHQAGLLIRGH